jgi:hypothetical protein
MSSPRDRFNYRNRFIQEIDASILLLGHLQNGHKTVLECFRIRDDNALEFRLCFEDHELVLPNDDHILTSKTFDDLIEQLNQVKIIAGFGGLDDALSTAAREMHSLPHESR